jgi:hypothetical protein
MKAILLALVVAALAAPGFAAVETWKNVPLVDAMCGSQVKANPDAHTAACALSCGAGGMGLLTSDGTFLKFDAAGTRQALDAIRASKKKDHLRATVTGERTGAGVKVQSLKLN